MYARTYAHTHTHTHTDMCTHTHMHARMHTHTQLYACTYACVHTHTHAHTHTQTHTHTINQHILISISDMPAGTLFILSFLVSKFKILSSYCVAATLVYYTNQNLPLPTTVLVRMKLMFCHNSLLQHRVRRTNCSQHCEQ